MTLHLICLIEDNILINSVSVIVKLRPLKKNYHSKRRRIFGGFRNSVTLDVIKGVALRFDDLIKFCKSGLE